MCPATLYRNLHIIYQKPGENLATHKPGTVHSVRCGQCLQNTRRRW